MCDQAQLPFVLQNRGRVFPMPPLPLPPANGLPHAINTYEDSPDEPRFDPAVHLDLKAPSYIRTLGDFEAKESLSEEDAKNGKFAYSSSFQVLSPEGVRVMYSIALKYQSEGVGPENARGNKIALRGLYYKSPFIRDFQNCTELRKAFKEIVGQELIPHPSFSNVPQVNLSVEEKIKSAAPLDHWHWDSVAYTGVILLNDMSGFEGGNLELMMMEKWKALKELTEGRIQQGVHSEVVRYESPGKMILAQGSEVLHHVTPLKSDHRRISCIIAYTPANCFEPTKLVLNSMRGVEKVHFMADYEFFREKAWQCAHALKHFATETTYEKDGKKLSGHLRVVAEELLRVSDLLDGVTDDPITFFNEVNKNLTSNYENSHKE